MKKTGEWQYRVFFLESEKNMFEKQWGRKEMSASIRKRVHAAVSRNRAALLKEWEAKVRLTEEEQDEL